MFVSSFAVVQLQKKHIYRYPAADLTGATDHSSDMLCAEWCSERVFSWLQQGRNLFIIILF